MTAEIAIINRSAIVLAADSAVILNVRGAEKIYTSAEKLFELSLSDPIGIMIYNNLEFMGVPLDVVIKQFRDTITLTKKFDTLEAATKADYLEKTVRSTADLEKQRSYEILWPIFRQIRLEFNDAAARALAQATRRRKVDYPTLLKWLVPLIQVAPDLVV